MVFARMKSFLLRNKKIKGDLTEDSIKILKDSTIEISEKQFIFSTKTDERYFNLSHLKNIFCNRWELRFEFNKKLIEFHTDVYDMLIKNKIAKYKRIVKIHEFNLIKNKYDDPIDNEVQILEDGIKGYLIIKQCLIEMSTDVQYYNDMKELGFVIYIPSFVTYKIVFKDKLELLEFISIYVKTSYASLNSLGAEESYFVQMELDNFAEKEEHLNNQSSIDSLKEEDKKDECKDDKKDNYKNEELQWEDAKSEKYSESEEYSESENETQIVTKNNDEKKNDYLLVTPENRTYVSRGNTIGIFANLNDELQFETAIKNLKIENLNKITEHRSTENLILSEKDEKNKLKKLDLSKGKIVETWSFNKDINDYFNHTGDNNSLIGVNNQAIFEIDLRLKDKIVNEKNYKTKVDFNYGKSTNAGVAIVSKMGDVRLYDRTDKNAKTLLPGFVDESRAIDVSESGEYILVTYKTYLMLIKVNSNYKMRIDKKDVKYKRLTLKPEHLIYINQEIDFKPAKFNQDADNLKIVTSTNQYLVSWNVDDVIKGDIYNYSIKKYNDIVIGNSFEFKNPNSIVVALQDDVRKIGTNRLHKMETEIKKYL